MIDSLQQTGVRQVMCMLYTAGRPSVLMVLSICSSLEYARGIIAVFTGMQALWICQRHSLVSGCRFSQMHSVVTCAGRQTEYAVLQIPPPATPPPPTHSHPLPPILIHRHPLLHTVRPLPSSYLLLPQLPSSYPSTPGTRILHPSLTLFLQP